MDFLLQMRVIKVDKASTKGINTNQRAETGAKLKLDSFCERHIKNHAVIKPSHIDPESPKNIFLLLPSKPRLKTKNTESTMDAR
mgnify:CR=1 FL=1